MAKAIELHPLAEKEISKAHRWYRKISASAGAGFLVEIDRAMAAIAEFPERWAGYLVGTQRYLVDRYPYVIIYRDLDTCVHVIAVSHGRRRPGYWKRRLTQA